MGGGGTCVRWAHVRVTEAWTSPELGGSGTWEVLQGPVSLSVRHGTLQTLQPTKAQRSGVHLCVPPGTITVVYIEEKMGSFYTNRGWAEILLFLHIKNMFFTLFLLSVKINKGTDHSLTLLLFVFRHLDSI